jgi:hypothetical protein
MTPAEGALYLGVPNLLFIRYQDELQMPFAIPMLSRSGPSSASYGRSRAPA